MNREVPEGFIKLEKGTILENKERIKEHKHIDLWFGMEGWTPTTMPGYKVYEGFYIRKVN